MEKPQSIYQSEIDDLVKRKLLLSAEIEKHFDEKHNKGPYSTCHKCINFGGEFRSIELLINTLKTQLKDQ